MKKQPRYGNSEFGAIRSRFSDTNTLETYKAQASGEQDLEAKTENLLGRSVSQRLRERIRKNSRGDTEAQRAVR